MPTILVVDDDAVVRGITARLLGEGGFLVVTAANGAEALALLERSSGIALVVSDLQMPQMDGRELAIRLRGRTPPVHMLFLTGHPELAQFADLPGPVLPKPYLTETLLGAVRAALWPRT